MRQWLHGNIRSNSKNIVIETFFFRWQKSSVVDYIWNKVVQEVTRFPLKESSVVGLLLCGFPSHGDAPLESDPPQADWRRPFVCSKGKLTFLLSDSWVRWGRRQLAGSYQAQIPASRSHSGVLLKLRSEEKWPQTFNRRRPSAAAKSRLIMSSKASLFQAALEPIFLMTEWLIYYQLRQKMLFCVAIWEQVALLPVGTSASYYYYIALIFIL